MMPYQEVEPWSFNRQLIFPVAKNKILPNYEPTARRTGLQQTTASLTILALSLQNEAHWSRTAKVKVIADT